eukprot:scaffold80541_cov18-Tisochrysis_lutea.AAC.1
MARRKPYRPVGAYSPKLPDSLAKEVGRLLGFFASWSPSLLLPMSLPCWAVGADWTCYGGGPGCSGEVVPGRAVLEQAESTFHIAKQHAVCTRAHLKNTFLNFKRHRVLKKQILRRWAATQGACWALLGRSSVY